MVPVHGTLVGARWFLYMGTLRIRMNLLEETYSRPWPGPYGGPRNAGGGLMREITL